MSRAEASEPASICALFIAAAVAVGVVACEERAADPCQELVRAGDLERKRGNREQAKVSYERALELAREAGNPRAIASVADVLFYMAWEDTDSRRALELALTSFEAAEESGRSDLKARASMALFSALFGLGDLAGAGRALERAELYAGANDTVLAYVFLNRAALRLDEGRMALSREAGNRALDDVAAADLNLVAAERRAEPGASEGVLLYYRSLVEHAHGREESALAAVEKALAQDPSPGWAWLFLLQRGVVQEALGERRQAEMSYGKAADAVEEVRAALDLDELKATLLDARRGPLEALFRLQAEDGRSAEALATAERATSRSFLDAFIQATSSRPDEPAEDWPTMAAADRAEALKALLPALSRSSAVAPRPVGSVLEALGDRHALIFFEAEDHFWRVTASKSRVEIVPLGASEEIGRLVDRFLEQVDARPPAEALGRRLLSAASLPAPGTPLFLVPDGVLGQVPFAALRLGGRTLVEDHPLVYLPSLSALAAAAGQAASPNGPAVVLGDPRGDLPAAAREAREVGALLRTVPSTGDGATREVLERAAGAAGSGARWPPRSSPRGAPREAESRHGGRREPRRAGSDRGPPPLPRRPRPPRPLRRPLALPRGLLLRAHGRAPA